MAITVRFPNGQAIRYNDLSFVTWTNDGRALLKREESSGWSVAVPKDALIEFIRPFSVSNPLASPAEAIDMVLANLRTYDAGKLKQLKTLLKGFNCHTFNWKP